MNTAEARVAARMGQIGSALAQALQDAAGEPMAYVLLVAPVGRKGDHIIDTNIENLNVAATFLRAGARILKHNFIRAQRYAQNLVNRGIN